MTGLEDRRAIDDLLVRYAVALDRKDWELLASCFTADAQVELRGRELDGRDATVEYVVGRLGPVAATQHLLGNTVVEVDGDSATAATYVQAQHFHADESFVLWGTYHDRLQRTADGWRIAERRLVPTWTSGNPELFELARSG